MHLIGYVGKTRDHLLAHYRSNTLFLLMYINYS